MHARPRRGAGSHGRLARGAARCDSARPIAGGVRVHPPRTTPIALLASLIEAEQTCCPLLPFVLRIGVDSCCLDITSSEAAEDAVHGDEGDGHSLLVEAGAIGPRNVAIEFGCAEALIATRLDLVVCGG